MQQLNTEPNLDTIKYRFPIYNQPEVHITINTKYSVVDLEMLDCLNKRKSADILELKKKIPDCTVSAVIFSEILRKVECYDEVEIVFLNEFFRYFKLTESFNTLRPLEIMLNKIIEKLMVYNKHDFVLEPRLILDVNKHSFKFLNSSRPTIFDLVSFIIDKTNKELFTEEFLLENFFILIPFLSCFEKNGIEISDSLHLLAESEKINSRQISKVYSELSKFLTWKPKIGPLDVEAISPETHKVVIRATPFYKKIIFTYFNIERFLLNVKHPVPEYIEVLKYLIKHKYIVLNEDDENALNDYYDRFYRCTSCN